MQEILKRVHVHLPIDYFSRFQDLVFREKLNLEIYFSHLALDNMDYKKCRQTAMLLTDAGIQVTFHAPFMDLRPGALDDKIRRASMERLKQVFELAPYFHPLRIVCHPSFDHRYYVSTDEEWLAKSVLTWLELIGLAREIGTVIALENVYEKEPSILRRLFERLPSDHICFCFDSGHFNVFSRTPLSLWLHELGKYLGEMHLHDNHGRMDEHLPIGNGTFPFAELFSSLRNMNAQPLMTIEAHAQNHLWESLANIKKMGLFRWILP